jgi:hypothetical protein
MKHTFILIEKLVDLLATVPRHKIVAKEAIEIKGAKEKAMRICYEIDSYIESLKKIVENHRTEKYRQRLQTANISKISDWAEQVTELFEKFDLLLYTLEKDVKRLKGVIKNSPKEWQTYSNDLVWGMYKSGLINDEEELKKFREIAIFEMHELNGIISKKHMAEIDAVLQSLK